MRNTAGRHNVLSTGDGGGRTAFKMPTTSAKKRSSGAGWLKPCQIKRTPLSLLFSHSRSNSRPGPWRSPPKRQARSKSIRRLPAPNKNARQSSSRNGAQPPRLFAPAHRTNEARPVPNVHTGVVGLLGEHVRGELASFLVRGQIDLMGPRD